MPSANMATDNWLELSLDSSPHLLHPTFFAPFSIPLPHSLLFLLFFSLISLISPRYPPRQLFSLVYNRYPNTSTCYTEIISYYLFLFISIYLIYYFRQNPIKAVKGRDTTFYLMGVPHKILERKTWRYPHECVHKQGGEASVTCAISRWKRLIEITFKMLFCELIV